MSSRDIFGVFAHTSLSLTSFDVFSRPVVVSKDAELVSYDRQRAEVLRRTVRSLVVAGAGAAEQHARLWQEALRAIDAAGDPS